MVDTCIGPYRELVCKDCWGASRNYGFVENTPIKNTIYEMRMRAFKKPEQPKKPILTEEQRQRMEQKKAEAIAKRKIKSSTDSTSESKQDNLNEETPVRHAKNAQEDAIAGPSKKKKSKKEVATPSTKEPTNESENKNNKTRKELFKE